MICHLLNVRAVDYKEIPHDRAKLFTKQGEQRWKGFVLGCAHFVAIIPLLIKHSSNNKEFWHQNLLSLNSKPLQSTQNNVVVDRKAFLFHQCGVRGGIATIFEWSVSTCLHRPSTQTATENGLAASPKTHTISLCLSTPSFPLFSDHKTKKTTYVRVLASNRGPILVWRKITTRATWWTFVKMIVWL
jgi:hypothetical protein